ncbi:acyltransferase family protein [Bacteroides congonensis]
MMINQYNSQKISVLSFVAIYFVMVIHANYDSSILKPVSSALQNFTGTAGLSVAAVPLFYFISGILFYRGVNTIGDCLPRMRKRVKSLLVPYVIWNIIFVSWYVVLEYIPGVSIFVNSDVVSNIDFYKPQDTLVYLFLKPAGFQLWFLRDLILYVTLSPVIYVGIKKLPLLTYLTLLLLFGGISRCGVTYFVLGGILAIHYDFEVLKRLLTKPLVCACITIYLTGGLFASGIVSLPISVFNPYYQQVISVIGIMAIWGGYDMLVGEEDLISNRMKKLMSYTFFIYLFHEPTFNIIKKLGLVMFGCNDLSLVLMYLINPIIMIIVAVWTGMICQCLMPRLYSIATGGR